MANASCGDYDGDPDRCRAGMEAVKRYSLLGDVHEPVAIRFDSERLSPTLDLGCGEGRLSAAAPDSLRIVSVDLSATMIKNAPAPKVRAEGTRLPFADSTFGSVGAFWCLYHFEEPKDAIREAWRVLREGGLFSACAPARDDDPEIAHIRLSSPSTFDAEGAAEIVADVFGEVEVERWDEPGLSLPDEEAVRLFLRGRGLSEDRAAEAAKTLEVPLVLTKRGCLVYAYRS